MKKEVEIMESKPGKNLINLENYNKEFYDRSLLLNAYPVLNGLACPKCNSELYDSDNSILTSMPAQKNVHCSKCDYKGYRYC
jgi:hypothetical protein